MQRSNYVAAAMLAMSAASVMAQTPTRPAETPQVTVGADTKMLIFDWDPVPGATYYQLYLNQDGHSGFTPTGGRIAAPGTRAGSSVNVHLQHWQDALYKVSACNAAGCRDSKALFPRRHMLETIGYFKASNTDPHDGFGHEVAVSGDGNTMAVTAYYEASNATGINGDQSDNSLEESGAVYVYRKVSGHWRQEAYIKAPDNHYHRHFGSSILSIGLHTVGLTTDGNTLVVGADEQQEEQPSKVFTYVRASNGAWSLQNTLTAPDARDFDGFGETVDISGDGQTLRVGNIGQGLGTSTTQGKAYLFVRSGPGWQFVQSLVFSHGTGWECLISRLSGDGSTLVTYCNKGSHDHYSGAHIETFRRSANTWSHVSDLDLNAGIIHAPAMSYDGTALAVRRYIDIGEFPTGKVDAFRWTNSGWVRERTFEQPGEPGAAFSDWGSSLSFNRDGSLLAIGDSISRPPGPPGVSEEIATGTAVGGGAVLVYQRVAGASPLWSFRSQVLPPNLAAGGFGISLALSATGNTLAVGAYAENSNAKGINGDQTDDSAPNAGAAYLY